LQKLKDSVSTKTANISKLDLSCHKIFSKLQGLLKARGQHFHSFMKRSLVARKKNAGIIPMKAAMLRNTYKVYSVP
jgi:hypothetical protein